MRTEYSNCFVPTCTGGVFTYLAKLPMLGDASGTRLAFLTSLLEVGLTYCIDELYVPLLFDLLR